MGLGRHREPMQMSMKLWLLLLLWVINFFVSVPGVSCLPPASCGRLTWSLVSRIQLQTLSTHFLTRFVSWLTHLIFTKPLWDFYATFRKLSALYWLHFPSLLSLYPIVNSFVSTFSSVCFPCDHQVTSTELDQSQRNFSTPVLLRAVLSSAVTEIHTIQPQLSL